MKWLGQSRNDAQLWMCLVVKVKSNAMKNDKVSQAGVVFLDIESADFSVILPLPQCCRRLLMNLLQPGIIESVSTPLPHRQWIFT